jgi:hypothetical protein
MGGAAPRGSEYRSLLLKGECVSAQYVLTGAIKESAARWRINASGGYHSTGKVNTVNIESVSQFSGSQSRSPEVSTEVDTK